MGTDDLLMDDYKDLFRDAVRMMAEIARAAGFEATDENVEPPDIAARVEHLHAELRELRAHLADEPGSINIGDAALVAAHVCRRNAATVAAIDAVRRERDEARAEAEEARLIAASAYGDQRAALEGWRADPLRVVLYDRDYEDGSSAAVHRPGVGGCWWGRLVHAQAPTRTTSGVIGVIYGEGYAPDARAAMRAANAATPPEPE